MREFYRPVSFRHGPGTYRAKHAHAEGQIFMLTSGMATFSCAYSNWIVLPHSPCWIPPNLRHEIDSKGEMTGISLKIDPKLCLSLPLEGAALECAPLLPALLYRLVELMPTAQRLERLTLVLIDEIRDSQLNQLQLPMPQSRDLRKVASAIVRNPQMTRSVNVWCSQLKVTERTFLRRFPLETGLTYVSWRQRARILKSLELLRSGLPVAEVALAVGYDSLSSYLKLFKRITGLTTRQFLTELRPRWSK
jgi:AraC-like DNA-binding protein